MQKSIATYAMNRAHYIRQYSAYNFGCAPKDIVWSECLRLAWREIKAEMALSFRQARILLQGRINTLVELSAQISQIADLNAEYEAQVIMDEANVFYRKIRKHDRIAAERNRIAGRRCCGKLERAAADASFARLETEIKVMAFELAA